MEWSGTPRTPGDWRRPRIDEIRRNQIYTCTVQCAVHLYCTDEQMYCTVQMGLEETSQIRKLVTYSEAKLLCQTLFSIMPLANIVGNPLATKYS